MNKATGRTKPKSDPSLQVRNEVKNIVETIIPSAITVGARFAERAYEKAREPHPFLVQVLDSTFDGISHHVFFRMTNNTQHGIYVESISLDGPAGDYQCYEESPPYDQLKSFGDRPVPGRFELPRHLPPEAHVDIQIDFPKCQNRGIDSDMSGTLQLSISRLEKPKQEKHRTEFRIRW